MVSSVSMAENGGGGLFYDDGTAEPREGKTPPRDERAISPSKEASQPISSDCSAGESELDWAASTRDGSEDERFALAGLRRELRKAKEKLRRKDEQVAKLMEIRRKIETELQDLTASLFQEAHAMVREANVKRESAEKALAESAMKVDVLNAQVSAMKALLTTPAPTAGPNQRSRVGQHRRFYSSDDSAYGREARVDATDGRLGAPSAENRESDVRDQPSPSHDRTSNDAHDRYEVDPTVFAAFSAWKDNPSLEREDRFIERIYRDDINQCLAFQNETLVTRIRDAVRSDQIYIEAVDKAKSQFQRKCALLQTDRMCHYRMRLADEDEWFYISQICRNRIIAACNLFSYLRYIRKGLVKSSAEDMYWEIVRLRKEMSLARFGLPACV